MSQHNEFKTIGRQTASKAGGCGITLLGLIIMLVSIPIWIESDSFGPLIIGFIVMMGLAIFGGNMMQKANHVAWTREALERSDYGKGAETPLYNERNVKCSRCQYSNLNSSNFCSNCSYPLNVKCEKCGNNNSLTEKFCNGCGQEIKVNT